MEKRVKKMKKIEQYKWDSNLFNWFTIIDSIICLYHFRKYIRFVWVRQHFDSLGWYCWVQNFHTTLRFKSYWIWLNSSCDSDYTRYARIHFLCSLSMQKMGLVSCYVDMDSTFMCLYVSLVFIQAVWSLVLFFFLCINLNIIRMYLLHSQCNVHL